jgi:hypothetical protein
MAEAPPPEPLAGPSGLEPPVKTEHVFNFDFNDYYDPAHVERIERLKQAAKQSRLDARASKAKASEAAAAAAHARTANDQAQKDANIARTVAGRASGHRAKTELAAAAAAKMKEAMLAAARAQKALEQAVSSLAEAERRALESEESAIAKAKAAQEARTAADRALEVSSLSREAERQSAARRAAAEEEARAMEVEVKAVADKADSLSADAVAKEADWAKCIRAAKGAIGTGKAWEQRTERAAIAAQKAHERTAAAAAKAAETAANGRAATLALLEMYGKAEAEAVAVEQKAADDAKITMDLAARADEAAKEADDADSAATAAEDAAEAAKHAMEAATKKRDDEAIAKQLEEETATRALEEAKAARLAEELASEKANEATTAAQLSQELSMETAQASRSKIADSEMKEAIASAAEADVKTMEEEAKEAALTACYAAEIAAAEEAAAKEEADRIAYEEALRRKAEEYAPTTSGRQSNLRTCLTSAQHCRLSGPGLQSATMFVQTSFWIEAFGVDGFRQPDGGDTFFVCIRCTGRGIRIRARVLDYGDGRYNVTYKPTVAGRTHISVSLLGEPLPGSPFQCDVSAPIAHAPNCTLSGEALNQVVAYSPGVFLISFRDVLNRLAHAVDLEVCVVRDDADPMHDVAADALGMVDLAAAPAPAAPAPSSAALPASPANNPMPVSLFATPTSASARPTSERPAHDKLMREGVVKPLGDFDRLVVGPKGLHISKGQSTDSQRIGQLRPGKPLKLLKLAEIEESGGTTIRACVELEKEETQSWRELYPQSPPWRAGMRGTEVELSLEALAQQSSRISHRDGLSGSRSLRKHGWQRDNITGLRRFGSAISARSTATSGATPSEPPSHRPTRLNFAPIQEEIKREELTPIQQLQEEEQPPDEPSVNAIAEDGTAKEGALSLSLPLKKPKPFKRSGSRKKVESDEVQTLQEEPAAFAPAAATHQLAAGAALEILVEPAETEEQLPAAGPAAPAALAAPPAPAAQAAPVPVPCSVPASRSPPKKKTSKKKIEVKPLAMPGAKANGIVPAAAKILSAAASQRDEEPDTAEPERDALPGTSQESAQHRQSLLERLRTQGGASQPETAPEPPPEPAPMSQASVRTAELLASTRSTYRSLTKMPGHGWITISQSGEELVTKEVGRLPAHVRQQHIEQWTRQTGLHSHRERDRAMARDEAQELEQRLTKELRGEVSQRVTARRATSAYLQELERDPMHIGFAYGGVYPGRLHAKGQLHESHEVHFSVGACGRYLLHVSLRPRATEPVIPLPGSPFTLDVIPGKAHPLSTKIETEALPLRGALEMVGTSDDPDKREARCSCTLRLLARDKMGNRCLTGGANLTCGSMSTEGSAELFSSVTDQGDGEYIICWWAPNPGSFTVFVKMDGLHIIGSPTAMQLNSGTPDLNKTDIAFDMLKNAKAGKMLKLRLHCKDAFNQPAVPGANVTIGITLLKAGLDKHDPEAWRQRAPEQLERSVIGDSLEIAFMPKLAGEVKAFLWAEIEESSGRSRSPTGGESRRAQSASSRQQRSTSTSPTGTRPPPRRAQKDASSKTVYTSEDDKRKLLPGSPVAMTIGFAEVSAKQSFIDNIYVQNSGPWEEVPDIIVNGRPKKRSSSPARSDEGSFVNPEDEKPSESTLQVGDTIKIKPQIMDQFHNPVSAKNGTLSINISYQNGKESIPMLAQLERSTGNWIHETLYELRSKGKYKLEVLLDEVPIPGSPVEWIVKPKAVTQERADKKDDKTPTT